MPVSTSLPGFATTTVTDKGLKTAVVQVTTECWGLGLEELPWGAATLCWLPVSEVSWSWINFCAGATEAALSGVSYEPSLIHSWECAE